MRKKIKIYLQYPWKFPDSPYYKYLIENPPKDIEYINTKNQKGVIVNKRFFWASNFLKRNIRRIANLSRFSIPNAHLSPEMDYNLIHCAHCLSKNNNKPWVADFEGAWQFYVGEKTKRAKERVRKILLSKNCRKIMPWTEETKKKIIEEFPEIKNKVEVIYPAVPLNSRNKKNNKKITILYATRYFWLKGGVIALEVYKKLKEKYGNKIELIFISDVPESVKKKYHELEIKNLVPQKELSNLYSKSDIFFYPSFMDTLGFGQLEAISFGIPIVTVKTKHTTTKDEIIKNNENGLVFGIEDKLTDKLLNQKENLIIGPEEREIINKLFENCSKLIENKNLREKIGKNNFKIVKSGKFSIKERNKKLRRIYEEALL